VKRFPLPDGRVLQACDDVALTLDSGETLGLVGESGSGKTTLGRCIIRLLEPDAGSILFGDEDLLAATPSQLRHLRARMQMVFQEPLDSLNPRLSIGSQLEDPLRIHTHLDRKQRRARVRELLEMVGLPASVAGAYPGSLSGGTAQRCSIARAIATVPNLIVLDEPTSALAPEAETELIALLRRLQAATGVAYIFISHDLSLVGEVCERVAVMYLSQIVEMGTIGEVFSKPLHPYTRALLAATLRPDPEQRKSGESRWERMGGEIPSPVDLPVGCYLASRCLYAKERCKVEPQVLSAVSDGRLVRCWRAYEGDLTPEDFEAAQRVAHEASEARVRQLVAEE
jgi:oligopeptide/dipeptide ABC transporter ATP-binding protein